MIAIPTGFIDALKKDIRGDIYHDPLVLGMYATDASIYQIMPVAVVCPKDEEDVISCVKIANTFHVPILARGGGTSLAGQTVAEAIVIDFSKYMNSILLLDDKTDFKKLIAKERIEQRIVFGHVRLESQVRNIELRRRKERRKRRRCRHGSRQRNVRLFHDADAVVGHVRS